MKKIGFLISGSGSTLQNFIDLEKQGKLKGSICVVISSKSDAYGLQRAKNNNIASYSVNFKEYKNNLEEYSNRISEILKKHAVDLVVMGGFMSFYKIPPCFENKVLNVHPALIPAFCGEKMYGHKVHEAVLEYGAKVTGATVHFVNNKYDNGPVIMQASVKVLEDDTADTLAERVQAKEREIYPIAVNAVLEDKVLIKGRRVFLYKK